MATEQMRDSGCYMLDESQNNNVGVEKTTSNQTPDMVTFVSMKHHFKLST